jgi:murein peptide amidase A
MLAVSAVAVAAAGACAPDDAAPTASTAAVAGTSSSLAASTSTAPRATAVAPTAGSAPAASSTTTTAAPTTTALPGLVHLAADAVEVVEIGRSVEGRPITAVRRGTPGGSVVLVIGVIHGDEDDGVAILERLATADVPAGVDLWLVESMNPDGQVAQRRTNANLVDLNRNFPFQWAPLGVPGDSQYGGTGAASEPETQAIVDFVTAVRPELGLWYHQDLFRLSPGEGLDGRLKARYAELTGLPILRITGGTYTGVAATWQRNTVDGVSFIVELGPTLSAAEADTHAAAVLELATIVAHS